MISLATYEQAESDFLKACRTLEPEIASVLLYGSAVRGAIRPGDSDLLDATIVFVDDVLRDEAQFGRVLDVMAETSRSLAGRDVPFHPFHYFSEEEVVRSYFTLYLECWQSDRFSKVAMGRDLRPSIASMDRELEYARGLFFAARRSFHEMARFLTGPLAAPERREALAAIVGFVKNGPSLACSACGCSVEPSEALNRLSSLLPALARDIDALPSLKEKARQTAPDPGEHEVRAMIGQTLDLLERIHDAVLTWRARSSEVL